MHTPKWHVHPGTKQGLEALGDNDYIDIQTGLYTENQPIRIDIEIQRGKKQTTQDASLGERNTKHVIGSRKIKLTDGQYACGATE